MDDAAEMDGAAGWTARRDDRSGPAASKRHCVVNVFLPGDGKAAG
jgi:hypothetical protein